MTPSSGGSTTAIVSILIVNCCACAFDTIPHSITTNTSVINIILFIAAKIHFFSYLCHAKNIVWITILVLTYKSFRFPNWMYVVMLLHVIVLLVGAHYSYAEVPLGYWMQDWFGFSRNNYDKIGHFMQGFTPTLMAMEIIRRKTDLKSFAWLAFISFSIAMMISAVYEIIEWLASLSNPTDTEAFLGTQGYIWDTQSDMFCCLIGSVCAVVVMLVVKRLSFAAGK